MTNEITCTNCSGSGCDSLSEQYEACATCNGVGREIVQSDYEIGDVVEYRDDETDQLMVATVIDFGAAGWLEVTHDGRPEDDAAIHESLVVRVVAWAEYLGMEAA